MLKLGMGARRRLFKTMAYTVVIGWSLISLFPIAWMYVSSFKEPYDVFAMPPKWVFRPTIYNYKVLFGLIVGEEFEGVKVASDVARVRSQFPRYLLNSAIVSLLTTGLATFFGALAAYSLTRFKFRFGNSLLLGIILCRMIPPIALLIPFYYLIRGAGLLDTHVALILTYMTLSLPFVVWMMRGFFMEIPVELDEAAMIDGCSRLGALVRVVLPLTAPGLAATSIFAIILSWNEFMFALTLTSENAKTVVPAIASFVTDKAILWGRLYAGGATIMLPIMAFALFVQRHLARGLTLGAVKQ